nr:MAG TPA: hypothetical protein [Caudoviricetes sp.]
MTVEWKTVNGTASGEVVSKMTYYQVRLKNGKTMFVAQKDIVQDETHRD